MGTGDSHPCAHVGTGTFEGVGLKAAEVTGRGRAAGQAQKRRGPVYGVDRKEKTEHALRTHFKRTGSP